MASTTDYSAGGIVTDEQGRVVLIRVQNADGSLRWSLPKGHPHGSESPEEAALRETAEETGLDVELISSASVATVRYDYQSRKGRLVRKTVDYWRMRAIGDEHDAHDDEVIEVALVSPEEAIEMLFFPEERQALREGLGR